MGTKRGWALAASGLGLVMAMLGAMMAEATGAERSERTAGLHECRLVEGETGLVASVVDGDTLVLDSGLEVRLVGMQAPKLPLGRPDFTAWPLAEEAKTALERMALGQAAHGIAVGAPADLVGLTAADPALAGRAGDAILDSWIFGRGARLVDCVWRRGVQCVAGGRHVARDAIDARYRSAMQTLLA